MSYQIGTVSVTYGSPTVVGIGTSWVANVSTGDLFKIQYEDNIYVVLSITNDTTLVLESNYAELTKANRNYLIVSITPNLKFPLIESGNRNKDVKFLLTWGLSVRLDEVCRDRYFYDQYEVDNSDPAYVIIPLLPKRLYTIFNNRYPADIITVKGITGTGITIAASKIAIVYTDGTNVVRITSDSDRTP